MNSKISMLHKQGHNVWPNHWSVKIKTKNLNEEKLSKFYIFLREEICKTLASISQTNSTNLKKFKQIQMTGSMIR